MKFVSLMYHNVHADGAKFPQLSPSVTSYFTGDGLFRDHLKELDAAGARTLAADDLPALYADKPITSAAGTSPFPVLLTFDDGWLGTLDVAGPILESHNASAILFVTTDFIDRPLFVTRKDLKHVPWQTIQLGSHARSHRMLAQLPPAEITAELRDSKAILEDITGRPIDCLSIPGGAIDRRVRQIAIEAGYRFICTSEVHPNTVRRGPHFIGRVPIRFNTAPAAVRRYITQRFGSERIRRQMLQLPKKILGRSRYETLRRVLLREAPGQNDMLDLRHAAFKPGMMPAVITTPEIIFVLLAGIVLYAYLFYPAALGILARIFPAKSHRDEKAVHSVSVIVAAFNEAPNIARRIREIMTAIETAKLDGELIVVSDGSTDDTVSIARAFEGPRMRVLALAQNGGKAEALSQAVSIARNAIIVFADARQTWASDALPRLVSNFQDPKVGAASGELMIESSPGTLAGVGLYWKIEKWVRRRETAFASAVGVTGAISSVRRILFRPIPQGTILDDVYWPMQVALQGYRVVFDGTAHAFDRLPDKSGAELRRKIRTLAGNFQLVVRVPALVLPWRNPIWWQFMSHKMCRLVVPWALIFMFILSIVFNTPLLRIALVAQIAFYLVGVVGLWCGDRCTSRVASAVSSFILLNAAAWLAFWVWALGRSGRSWNKTNYIAAASLEKAL